MTAPVGGAQHVGLAGLVAVSAASGSAAPRNRAGTCAAGGQPQRALDKPYVCQPWALWDGKVQRIDGTAVPPIYVACRALRHRCPIVCWYFAAMSSSAR